MRKQHRLRSAVVTIVFLVFAVAATNAHAASSYAQIEAGDGFTCGVTTAGSVKCWGSYGYAVPTLPRFNQGSSSSSGPVTVAGLRSGVSRIALNEDGGCAIVRGGAQCWGDHDGSGQATNGPRKKTGTRARPVAGLDSGVTDIAVGWRAACAVVNGGVKCWGNNSEAQLGNGSTTSSTTPVDVTGIPAGSGASRVSLGSGSCAIVAGAAWCWGRGVGALAGSSETESLVPIAIPSLASGVTEISGYCALANGSVSCWGDNSSGRLGNGTLVASPTPVQVLGLGSGVTDIDAGGEQNCAVESGTVKCWGRNFIFKRLLYDTRSRYETTATAISHFGAPVNAISVGSGHACALVLQAARCWGHDLSDVLGDQSTMRGPNFAHCHNSQEAVRIKLARAIRISCYVMGTLSVRPELAIQTRGGSYKRFKLSPISWRSAARGARRQFTIMLSQDLLQRARARLRAYPYGLQVMLSIRLPSGRSYGFNLK